MTKLQGALDAVVLDRLTVRRGESDVLRGVSAAVPAGRIIGLIGPSGCGKTTLMRSVVGVQARVTGTVTVLGRPAGHPMLRSLVGYVTQATSVYADLTVAQNLRYFARILRVDAAAVARTLDAVDLTRFAGRRVGGLSGGERARVSLATALLNRRRFSSWTNRRSGSTRCSATSCGRCSAGWPTPGRRCSCRAMSWTRRPAVTRCC